MRMSVDLPEPDSPAMPRQVLRFSSKDTSCTAYTPGVKDL